MKIDKELISNCKRGQEQAFYKLYEICFSDLMSVCVRYFRNKNDAAPILNQAFLRITQNLDKYSFENPWDRWIKRIMINTIINDYQSQKKNKEIFIPTDFDSNHLEFDSFSLNEITHQMDVEHIQSMIHSLPENQKTVFNLYAIDGYNHREIGELLNIPVGTSKWLLAEARKKLKGLITQSLNTNKAIAI
ncbi:MAG: RNA polymerase sigma factor [Salibacteraceae bacterium]